MFAALLNLVFWVGGAIVQGFTNQLGIIAGDQLYKATAVAVTFVLGGVLVGILYALVGSVMSVVTISTYVRVWVSILVPPHWAIYAAAIFSARFSRTVYKFAKYNLSLYTKAKL